MAVNYNAPIKIRDGRNGGWLWVDKEVWSDERLSASDKVAYGTLAYFANNKTQTLFPSIRTLEQFSKLSTRQTYKSVKKLEKFHYIRVVRKHGKPNEYTLIDDAIQAMKQGGAKFAGVQDNSGTTALYASKGVHNNSTNKNKEQELINNTIIDEFSNSSYKTEVERIAEWAYVRARVSPSIPREKFCEAVEIAIGRAGWEAVHREFEYEENAITFLTNIKSL